MKKILAAILAGAFGLSAVAQTVVYDYKATFKRLNPIYKIRKENKVDYVTESYGVSSDTLTGFVMLPVCNDCVDPLVRVPIDSSINPHNGHAYLTRKGDKYSKTANIPFVVKVDVDARSAIFGKSAYILGTDPADTTPSNAKQLKSAWMNLQYTIPGPVNATLTPPPAPQTVVDPGHKIPANLEVKKLQVNPKNPLDYIWYGFMGLDNKHGGFVNNSGFGTVKILSGSSSSALGLCGPTVTKTPECRLIQSISGSTLGEFGYQGICNGIPMWDLCAPDADGQTGGKWQPPPYAFATAPIAGTWTLKLNTKITKIEGKTAADKRRNQEAEILKRLKVTDAATQVYGGPGTGAIDINGGLTPAKTTNAWDTWYPGF